MTTSQLQHFAKQPGTARADSQAFSSQPLRVAAAFKLFVFSQPSVLHDKGRTTCHKRFGVAETSSGQEIHASVHAVSVCSKGFDWLAAVCASARLCRLGDCVTWHFNFFNQTSRARMTIIHTVWDSSCTLHVANTCAMMLQQDEFMKSVAT